SRRAPIRGRGRSARARRGTARTFRRGPSPRRARAHRYLSGGPPSRGRTRTGRKEGGGDRGATSSRRFRKSLPPRPLRRPPPRAREAPRRGGRLARTGGQPSCLSAREDDDLERRTGALQLERVPSLLEREGVRDQRQRVDLTTRDQLERRLHVARAGGVAGGDGQLSAEQGSAVEGGRGARGGR